MIQIYKDSERSKEIQNEMVKVNQKAAALLQL